MKRHFLILFLLSFLAFTISAQDRKARKIDEFGILPCDDMLARINNIFLESQKLQDSKIYVVFYGGRFRKEVIWSKKVSKVQLKYPHRDDALNRAKAIPLYLTTDKYYSGNALKERIILIDGGFRENIEMEIWIAPKDVAPPVPTPTISEKDIKFRAEKPFGTPEYGHCYDGY